MLFEPIALPDPGGLVDTGSGEKRKATSPLKKSQHGVNRKGYCPNLLVSLKLCPAEIWIQGQALLFNTHTTIKEEKGVQFNNTALEAHIT